VLAASVVATSSAVGGFPRLKLGLMLVITGLVFWAAHVYARWAGERRLSGDRWSRREIRRLAGHEWSIVEASLLPAIAVAVSGLLGLDLTGTAWLAISVAVAQQVGWACLGAVRASVPRLQVVAEGAQPRARLDPHGRQGRDQPLARSAMCPCSPFRQPQGGRA
jgi:hypothetical protein